FTYYGSADGTYLLYPPDDMPDDYDARTRPWYQDAIAAGGSTLTEPYLDVGAGGLVMTLATPVRSNGQTLGVVGGDLALGVLVKIINSLDFGGLGHAFLVSADGKVLVHPDQDRVGKSLNELYLQNTPRLGSRYS